MNLRILRMSTFAFMVFSLLMTIDILPCHAAQLGTGKQLKVDNGPTLDQTMGFIKEKIPSFSVWKININYDDGMSVDETQFHDIIYDNCIMKYTQKITSKARDSVPMTSGKIFTSTTKINKTYEFSLTDMSNVKINTTNTIPRAVTTPAVYYLLTLHGKNVKYTEETNEDGQITTKIVDYDGITFEIQTQEYATRLSNAFERALQLCGGGEDIGKQELF